MEIFSYQNLILVFYLGIMKIRFSLIFVPDYWSMYIVIQRCIWTIRIRYITKKNDTKLYRGTRNKNPAMPTEQ